MTATEELRRLLDERGVEWMPIAWNPKRETFYHTSNGVGFCADEYTDGVKIYTDSTITPEQAVEATLGRGTCKIIEAADTICELQDENAKLRELVRKLHDELVSCEENEYVPGGHKFDGDVRELGVEVDG